MAEIIKNSKYFKVIKVSLEEVKLKFRGLGICDSCNGRPFSFMYIPVLHSCYCQACFDEWISGAVKYEEDLHFENKAFENAKNLLNIKSL
jgi:hypothetical protein